MGSEKHLNIISFDIPYPANYGGVIDVYYRIKALSDSGINIHLHCFKYGRDESEQLKKICKKVYYYHRSKSVTNQLSFLPFIVKSRKSSSLLANLRSNNYPVLFEGIHCCSYLNHPALKNRVKVVRAHNIEHHYYKELSIKSNSVIERIYYRIEAAKLKNFEKVYNHADYIASISKNDRNYFQDKYGNTFLLLPGHQNNKVKSLAGQGNFILFHGNLSVEENEEAALFIVKEIASKIDSRFYIAGMNPSDFLKESIRKCGNVFLIENPGADEMQQLIRSAHINLLPTFQSTGFKLKLLNSLYNGRFCLGTPQLTDGTGLQPLVEVAFNNQDFIKKIDKLLQIDFTNEMIQNRKMVLKYFDNRQIISVLIDKLYV